MKPALIPSLGLILATVLSAAKDPAADLAPAGTIVIRFENHGFSPIRLEVAAGRPLTLRVENASGERIEFESLKLDREKVVEPGKSVVLHFRGLTPGTYDFYDDFHSDVLEGTLLAR